MADEYGIGRKARQFGSEGWRKHGWMDYKSLQGWSAEGWVVRSSGDELEDVRGVKGSLDYGVADKKGDGMPLQIDVQEGFIVRTDSDWQERVR